MGLWFRIRVCVSRLTVFEQTRIFLKLCMIAMPLSPARLHYISTLQLPSVNNKKMTVVSLERHWWQYEVLKFRTPI
jgi:hypothetical protein